MLPGAEVGMDAPGAGQMWGLTARLSTHTHDVPRVFWSCVFHSRVFSRPPPLYKYRPAPYRVLSIHRVK